ncbi:MAG: PKD domain-containing protein [Bacteroidota bacterium]
MYKNILLSTAILFLGSFAFAQNYNIANGSISACSGNFYDSGGNGGTYGNSQNFVYTICPPTAGSKVMVNFTMFDIENSWDLLTIYDGNSTGAPTLGTYTGTTGPGLVSATAGNASGCLTFVFTSDGSVTYSGWAGAISCTTPCTTINSGIASTTPAASAGVVRLCQGQAVSVSATAATGGTGPYTYSWNWGDGTANSAGINASHSYASSGSYIISLVATAANGCTTTTAYQVNIQVSTTPVIATNAAPNPICLGQSANLSANVTMTPFLPNCTPPVSGTTFLPDGSGVSYSTSINVNCFNAGQTITSAANISNVCMTLEHSYLGDLNIVLVCPNGQSMILKAYPGGNGTYLGNPIDDVTSGPGTGFNYCFTPGATTLMVNGGTVPSGSPAGNAIAAGNYMPVNPFTNLIGCPMNGAWTIQVTDNLGSDDGYIFNWDVNFTVPAATGGFTPTIASQGWQSATGLTSTGTTTATVTPTAAGTPCYTYFVTDNFGCTYTQNQCVTVNPNIPVSAGPDRLICGGGSTTLLGSGAATYTWSPATGLSATNVAVPTASPAVTTTYTVSGTSAAGCVTTDQVVVTVSPNPTINAGPDVAYCNGGSTNLSASGGTSYTWSPATGLSATNISNPISTATTTTTYTVTGTNAAGCTATDQVIVTVNPIPTVNAGVDQTVCAGTSVTLTGSGASTYTWNNGVTNGVAFTPAVGSLTYTVTGTTAAGCINTDQVVVNVNPIPVINAGPDVSICASQSTVLTASGGTTYTWSPATGLSATTGASVTATPASTQTYTVTGTTGGCTSTDAVTVTVGGSAAINAGADVAICIGGSTILTATGGVTYTWSPATGLSGTTGASVTATPAATITYTVVGTNASGCLGTDQVVVTVNPLPTINAGADVAICNGASTNLLATGGATYTWSPATGLSATNVANPTANPAATQTYTVTGTTAAGCVNTDQVVVTVNPLPTVNAGVDQSVCTGTSVTLNGAGASIYTWNNGVTNGVAFTPVATQTYTVTGTSAAGCINTDQVIVSVLTSAPINAGADVAICNGASTNLVATGGVTYTWSPATGLSATNIANPVANPSTTQTYTVLGTDGNGCTGTDQVVVTVNPIPTINAGADVAICNGASTNLLATGGATYTWSPATGLSATNVANPTANPAATQTYTVTGTTAAGCTNTDQVVVTVNPIPTVNAGVDQTVCAGTSVTLNGSGASTYTWNNGVSNGVAFTPVATQTYTVTGTTAAGCTATDQVVVTVNPLPIVNAGVDQTVCSGVSVTLSGAGASTYSWNNGVTNGVAFTPTVGSITYTVTGTTGAGCTATDQVLVTVNPNPSPVIQGPTQYCAGSSATLSTSTPFSTYTWSTGVSTATASVTIANNPITVSVTNAFGCSAISSSFTVTENSVITANFTETICQGQSVLIHGVSQSVAGLYSQTFILGTGCDSVANVTLVVNPLPPVNAGIDQIVCSPSSTTLTASGAATYVWNNGITNGVPFTQAVGLTTYTVTGTDANGCINTDQVAVTVNPLPVVGAGADFAICSGATATLNGTGASTYTWNNGVVNGVAFTPALTNTYTVTGTDVNGCISTDQIVVTVNSLPPVAAGLDQTTCAGGSVTLNGAGATTYTWNNGITNGVAFTPAGTLTYTITGTDGNGCINTDQVVVTVAGLPTVNAGTDVTVCSGTSVTLNGAGASTYTWNNGITNGVAFTPAVGSLTYTVTGTDAGGCINTDQVVVTVNPLPVVGAGADFAICSGATATLNGTGASTYTWNNGVVNGVAFTPALTNTYTVTGTDVNGCISTDQIVVTVNSLPPVAAGLDQTTCAGGSVTLNGAGATTYTWNNGITNGVAFTPAGTLTYTITGTDGNGCINTDQVVVNVNALPLVGAGIDVTVCEGSPITLTAIGASTYSWSPLVTNGAAFIAPVGTATYTVTGTDLNGCINTDNLVVTVNPNPIVNAGPDQVICVGPAVTLNGAGANTYTWTNGVTNGLAFTPSVGTIIYTVTGTTVAGCTGTDQVIVTVNALPNVFAGNDVVVCENQSVTLTGSGANLYTWNNGILNAIPFSPAIGTLTYTVTGTDANGCVNTDAVDVLVNPNPVVSFTNGVTNGCVPYVTTLTNTTPNATGCVWTLSDGQVLTGCGNINLTISQAGCFDVTLTTQDLNGCSSSMLAPNLFCGENYPVASFSPDQNPVSMLNTEVHFENTSMGATNYFWTFGVDADNSTDVNPVYTFPNVGEGLYEVTLIAYSALGCPDTVSQVIQVYEETIFYVPNAFTPDNDAHNPTFQPIFTSGFDKYDFVMFIYNRWGEVIFETHDATIGWNGSYGQNGEILLCQDGVYTWKIEFKTTQNDKRVMKVGHVSLIR